MPAARAVVHRLQTLEGMLTALRVLYVGRVQIYNNHALAAGTPFPRLRRFTTTGISPNALVDITGMNNRLTCGAVDQWFGSLENGCSISECRTTPGHLTQLATLTMDAPPGLRVASQCQTAEALRLGIAYAVPVAVVTTIELALGLVFLCIAEAVMVGGGAPFFLE